MFTTATCASLLVFYILAAQCLSTTAVVRRETNSWKWPLFQIAYMTGLAYVAAFIVYQVVSRFVAEIDLRFTIYDLRVPGALASSRRDAERMKPAGEKPALPAIPARKKTSIKNLKSQKETRVKIFGRANLMAAPVFSGCVWV